MSKHRTLVTGGAGFIGSHLVRALLDRGDEVVVLDNLSTGKVANLPGSGRLHLEVGDITDTAILRNAMRGCQAVVHLAAIASVEKSIQEPLSTSQTNLYGSIHVFTEAINAGVEHVLYASSAAIYGDSQSLPLKESSTPNPLSPYAIDKLAGEQYLAHFHRGGAVHGTTFRFFNVFGPRQDPKSPYSGVVSIFLDRALSRSKATVYGDGLQSRDFIYVGDVVAALIAGLTTRVRTNEMQIFNVARGQSTSILNLVEILSTLPELQGPIAIEHKPARSGDIRHSLADSTKLQQELSWEPRTSIAEGLKATLNSVSQ